MFKSIPLFQINMHKIYSWPSTGQKRDYIYDSLYKHYCLLQTMAISLSFIYLTHHSIIHFYRSSMFCMEMKMALCGMTRILMYETSMYATLTETTIYNEYSCVIEIYKDHDYKINVS